jgi:hypothetical protein
VGGVYGDIEWFVFVPEHGRLHLASFKAMMDGYSAKELSMIGRLHRDEYPSFQHYQKLEDVQFLGKEIIFYSLSPKHRIDF